MKHRTRDTGCRFLGPTLRTKEVRKRRSLLANHGRLEKSTRIRPNPKKRAGIKVANFQKAGVWSVLFKNGRALIGPSESEWVFCEEHRTSSAMREIQCQALS